MWSWMLRTLAAASAVVVMVGAVGLCAVPVSARTEVVETSLVSVASDGTQAKSGSYSPSVSANGSTVVYTSYAPNLVTGDTNGYPDVFVFDAASRETARVSVASDGTQSNHFSYSPSVSADGSAVVYRSYATNLVTGDTNGVDDVFLFDVGSGVTRRISVASDGTQANGGSYAPSVSGDGSMVVYESHASNLVAGDTNGADDVFVFDVASGVTRRVSVASDGTQANADSDSPSVSADGSRVVYRSDASNLVTGDTNGHRDMFVFDTASGETTLVSVASDGTQADADSWAPSVSGDGSLIAYTSYASNLVAGDTNGFEDVFVFDVGSGVTRRVSVASDGTQAKSGSYEPSVSADGSTVVYSSWASHLVTGETNYAIDVFVFDIASGETTLLSVAPDGGQGNADSWAPSVSGDGSMVVYQSDASNLVAGDTNSVEDIFMTRINRGPDAMGFSVTVAEDVAAGTVLGSVSGSDLDHDPLTYEISAGNAANLFAIGSATGEVTVVKTLDYESASSHALTVIVSDGSLTDASTVTVTVTDVDETQPPLPPPPGDTFTDDDDSIFESDIEWMAAEGITRGCNPPRNDRFCPEGLVTRGQMAAFLVRALDLTDRLQARFVDDDGSVFEADIERLATARITLGCNPPANDRFCPDAQVTRGQMAAFLVRALSYTDSGRGDLFVDDDDSIFEADIDRLGTAGVTRGCNPPTNDRFCPKGNVTRGQMAAFLHRALG